MIVNQLNLFERIVDEKWVISLRNNLWDEKNQCFSERSLLSVNIFPTEQEAQKYYQKYLKKTLKNKKVSTVCGLIKATELVKIRLMTEHELKLLSIQRGEVEL